LGEKETKEQFVQLSQQIGELTKKVDEINSKLTKVESSSEVLTSKMIKVETASEALSTKIAKVESDSSTLVAQSQSLVANTDANKATEIMKTTIANPSGFLANEMTDFLFKTLEKDKSTAFRRWLSTSGKNAVEKNIAMFVQSKIPQLNWHGATVTNVGDKTFKYNAASSFPFEVNSGIPLIGKVTIAKVIMKLTGDVNSETREITNLKTSFSSEQPQKEVFDSFRDDFVASIKPHKITYAILSPIGRAVNKLYLILKKETAFSIPLLLFLLAGILNLWVWPAQAILWSLRIYPPYYWVLGISVPNFTYGLLNGVLFGAIVWLLIKFRVLEKLNAVLAKRKGGKPGEGVEGEPRGLKHFVLRHPKQLLIILILIIAIVAGAWIYMALTSGPQYPWMFNGAYATYNGTYTIENTTYSVTMRYNVIGFNSTHATFTQNVTTIWAGGYGSNVTTKWFDLTTKRFTPDINNFNRYYAASLAYNGATRTCTVYEYLTSPSTTSVYYDQWGTWILKQAGPINGTYCELDLINTNIPGLIK